MVFFSSHWMTDDKFCKNAFFGCWKRHHLVGGLNQPLLKNSSEIGFIFPKKGVNIKNLWNHQPGSWYFQANLGPTNISPQVSVTFDWATNRKHRNSHENVVLGQWGLPISWVTLISLQPRGRFNLILCLPPKQPKKKSFFLLVKWKTHHSCVSQIRLYKKKHIKPASHHMRNPQHSPPTSSKPHLLSPSRELPAWTKTQQSSNATQPIHPRMGHLCSLDDFKIQFRRSCTTWFRWFGVPPKSAIPFGVFHDKPSILGYVPLSLKGVTP